MDYFIIILFSILIIILLISYYNRFILNQDYLKENFQDIMSEENITYNQDATTNEYTMNNNYLYPIKGLSNQCQKLGFIPSYMPQICSIDGVVNSYANCMCQDKDGNCKKCYPELQKYNKGAHVIYNNNVSMEYTPYDIKSVNPDSLVDKNNKFDITGISSNNNYAELPQPGLLNNEKCKKYYDDLQKCNNEFSS